MPDRAITMVDDWGRWHQKDDKKKALPFLNHKKQLYDWDNNNLEDDKGLIQSDIAHPNTPAKFPGIDLESTTTKLSKSLKKVTMNEFTLHNAMHPLMISLAELHDCQLRLMKFR